MKGAEALDLDRLLASGGALRGPLGEAFLAELVEEKALREGDLVGRYRVLREIGRGGMSVVYLAERADDAFQQRVALKVLDRAPRDREARSRFEQERQILASLEHPNIARLLDGGVDGRGVPYIVMELVEGERIDQYCEQHRLSVDERLALFQVVAQAVAYAHRRLVVHRDLKPSNILVTAAGEVKLLDFGIAKLLDPEAAGVFAVPPTRTVLRVLTPEYAAPEQVRGEPVTTASDVYQLGLVLFELLTGRRAHDLGGDSLVELERVVCAGEPPRPSRSASSAALRRRLEGDLDSIVLTALRKEPDRRYPSPADLAADLERHLKGLPVTARPDALLYRAGKFVRRHRLALAAVVAVAVSLAGGFGAALWQARQARLEAKKATEVKDFLVQIFERADPFESGGRTVTARELLDHGVQRIARLEEEPEVQAELLAVAGSSYRGLGVYDSAQPLLERSLRLQRRLHGERSLGTADVQSSLALLAFKQGDTKRSEALLRAALSTYRTLLPADDVRVADALVGLAACLMDYDRDEESAVLLRQALAIRKKRSGPADPQVGLILNELGMLRHRARDLDAAERLYRESLAIQRRAYGPLHPEVAVPLHNLGALLKTRGRLTEAEAVFREVITLETKLYGGDYPGTADSWGYLGHVLRARDDFAGAEAAYRRSLAINRAKRAADHFATFGALHNLGKLLVQTGRAAEAEPLLREALAGRNKLWGPEYRKTKETAAALAECLAALGPARPQETVRPLH
ncbi:MAG TPA: serine/threonine-protein kinase [Thermoanaerobaculia bacterium]|nr:serine/threonine-protein kinase [Thermoanaerobaculia bacterium]